MVVRMGNVVKLQTISYAELNPDDILEAAIGKMERVTIIGRTKDGEEYLAFSDPESGVVVWDLERAKHLVVSAADE